MASPGIPILGMRVCVKITALPVHFTLINFFAVFPSLLLPRFYIPALLKGGFSSYDVKRQIGEVNDGGRGLFRFW